MDYKDISENESDSVKEKSFASLKSELNKLVDDKDALIFKQEKKVLEMRQRNSSESGLMKQYEDLERRRAQIELERKRLEEDVRRRHLMREKITSQRNLLKQQEEDLERLKKRHKKEIMELKICFYQELKQLVKKQKLEVEGIQSHPQARKQAENNLEFPNRSVQEKVEELEELLKEKNDELEGLEEMNSQLIYREHEANYELQKARKAIMEDTLLFGIISAKMLLEDDNHSNICIKKMGEICDKPWKEACKQKFYEDNWEMQYTKQISLWNSRLRDPSWFPFKIESRGDKNVQVVDWTDENLNELKRSLGEEVCNSVIQALKELNVYNASGRYPARELWNVKENRNATLTEVIEVLISKNKQKANKRRRPDQLMTELV